MRTISSSLKHWIRKYIWLFSVSVTEGVISNCWLSKLNIQNEAYNFKAVAILWKSLQKYKILYMNISVFGI